MGRKWKEQYRKRGQNKDAYGQKRDWDENKTSGDDGSSGERKTWGDRRNRDLDGPSQEPWTGTNERNYKIPDRKNDTFEKFYQGQELVPEGEWDEFLKYLRKDLPVTFRITGSRREAKQLLNVIKGTYFNSLVEQITTEGVQIQPPKNLSWYPDELAWQLELSRQFIRSNQVMSRLHDVLIAETETGNISRQEAVSMLPPLLMDIQPHHKILDMCAAPGSKTAQLIEMLHSSESGEIPAGFVMANDNDNKRCYLMVHQIKRLQSPNFIIVNEDATVFPKLRTTPPDQKPEFMQFDRILADVPCTGDATMRKNADVWSKWKPSAGPNLHFTQLKILKRGLELLAIGGRLVYSTCSFNPCENEAVVAEMLRRCQGSLELVDVSDKLSNLKYVTGLKKWRCMSHDAEFFDSFENVPKRSYGLFKPSQFPPTEEELEWMHLERCIRILPHHQDTGGFFLCALQKVKGLPWTKEGKAAASTTTVPTETTEQTSATAVTTSETAAPAATAPAATEDNADSDPPRKKQRVFSGYKEDPFYFFKADDPLWPELKHFYTIPDDFPMTQVMYRSNYGNRKHLYFVSAQVRHLVEMNADRLKFVNMGIRMMSRNPSPNVPECDFRINQECLSQLHDMYTGRYVTITRDDLVRLLSEENPYYFKFSEATQEQVQKLSCGSTVFHFKPTEQDPDPICDVYLCGWKGKLSIRAFVGHFERQHYLFLCNLHLDDVHAEIEKKKAEKAAAAESAARLAAAQAKRAGLTPIPGEVGYVPPEQQADRKETMETVETADVPQESTEVEGGSDEKEPEKAESAPEQADEGAE